METNVFFSAVQSAIQALVNAQTAPLVERIEKLETENKAYAILFQNYEKRIAALENAPAGAQAATSIITPEVIAKIVESMNDAEWLWNKVNNYIDAGVERSIESAVEVALDEHCSNYDHDSYDSLYQDWSDYDPASFASEDDLRSKIQDVLNDVSFDVRISL